MLPFSFVSTKSICIAFGLSACLLVASCSKEKGTEVLEDASLQVNVVGLEEYIADESQPELSSTTSRASAKMSTKNSLSMASPSVGAESVQTETLYVGDDFDILFSELQTHPKAQSKAAASKSSSANTMRNTKAAVAREPLATAVKYRLLIYRANETTPIVNIEASSGTSPNIAIASGFSYRWVAISTNETTTAPTITGNVVSRTAIANKDFLYASGTLLSQFGENYLNLVFKRYTTRIQLTVDARGMFGSIAAGSNISFQSVAGQTSSALTETADFNVLDSTFSNHQAVALSSNMMQNVNTTHAASLMRGTIYTVRPRAVAAGALRLRLNPLQITLDDGATRTFADNAVSFGSAFSPVRGSSYEITARLIESGVRVGTSNTRWARSNLTYAAARPDGFRYRFRPHPINYQFDAALDLWNYGTATPTSTSFTLVDPCLNVYPQNAWRLPTPEEFQGLPALPNSLERYVPLLLGGVGMVSNWNRSDQQAANSAYAEMDQLRLPFYGFRTTTGGMTQQPGLLLLIVSGQGHYLTNSAVHDGSWTASSVRPLVFYMNYSGLDLLGLLNLLDGYSQTVSNIPAGLTNAPSTRYNQGRNVRCVRNVSTTATATGGQRTNGTIHLQKMDI